MNITATEARRLILLITSDNIGINPAADKALDVLNQPEHDALAALRVFLDNPDRY